MPLHFFCGKMKKQVNIRKALLDWNPTSSKVQLFKRINSPVDNCMYRNHDLSTNLRCMKWNMYRWTSRIQSCTNKNTALKWRQETKHGSFMATLRQTTCLWLFWLHQAWTTRHLVSTILKIVPTDPRTFLSYCQLPKCSKWSQENPTPFNF